MKENFEFNDITDDDYNFIGLTIEEIRLFGLLDEYLYGRISNDGLIKLIKLILTSSKNHSLSRTRLSIHRAGLEKDLPKLN